MARDCAVEAESLPMFTVNRVASTAGESLEATKMLLLFSAIL
jgi:hypothetical protein